MHAVPAPEHESPSGERMTPTNAHGFGQDATEYRGTGIAALVLGGCVFLAFLILHMALSALRDLLNWLVGPARKNDR